MQIPMITFWEKVVEIQEKMSQGEPLPRFVEFDEDYTEGGN